MALPVTSLPFGDDRRHKFHSVPIGHFAGRYADIEKVIQPEPDGEINPVRAFCCTASRWRCTARRLEPPFAVPFRIGEAAGVDGQNGVIGLGNISDRLAFIAQGFFDTPSRTCAGFRIIASFPWKSFPETLTIMMPFSGSMTRTCFALLCFDRRALFIEAGFVNQKLFVTVFQHIRILACIIREGRFVEHVKLRKENGLWVGL